MITTLAAPAGVVQNERPDRCRIELSAQPPGTWSSLRFVSVEGALSLLYSIMIAAASPALLYCTPRLFDYHRGRASGYLSRKRPSWPRQRQAPRHRGHADLMALSQQVRFPPTQATAIRGQEARSLPRDGHPCHARRP